ncbi:hypothetical protein UFOVP191_18 [uncultured Caudovirales phage]|uniref:Uncharacterized protein n=1 Tax=uncultured Caudovirales phage TaxID=2100421 RepID=A0A6J7WMZ2_9CAUD|nr:hypothetical protein UFOVP191_18 [uncultured Caudovirales phage]
MARSRNIKPSFFTNDKLSECAPLARILFVGLWTVADRGGRLEDRPKKIKAEVLPYDDCDCDKLLNELSSYGFIVRYTHGENQYIQVVNFEKHQNPHIKESASTIPAPDLHGANTILAQPLTDSLLLIPDSPIPRRVVGSRFALASIPDDWIKFCSEERPDLDAHRTFDRFSDYWKSKAGRDGIKLDWMATWRNWVRSDKSVGTKKAGAEYKTWKN